MHHPSATLSMLDGNMHPRGACCSLNVLSRWTPPVSITTTAFVLVLAFEISFHTSPSAMLLQLKCSEDVLAEDPALQTNLPRTQVLIASVGMPVRGCGSSGANGVRTWKIERPEKPKKSKKKKSSKKTKKKRGTGTADEL